MKKEIYPTLKTKFAEKMDKAAPWADYPRPMLVRDSYLSLNGEWDFSITKSDTPPDEYKEKILVPFPPESLLSGVEQRIKKGDRLAYRTRFTLPEGFLKDRLILHIDAVDQTAVFYVNGKEAGKSENGYLPVSLDITDLFVEGENTLEVIVRDDLCKKYPYGKQRRSRGGMWYTPVSGIWQSVWLESLPTDPILSIKVDVTLKNAKITVNSGAETKKLTLSESGEVYEFTGDSVTVEPQNIRNWSPEDPYLYYFTVETDTDRIESYFALRTVDVRNIGGINRLCLNGKPYLFSGLLDQGYYPDGIFLPATKEAFAEDILRAKEMGFNMLRKHIKIEPMIFYNLCDRLGMVVFQDMVNNSGYSFILDTALPTVGFRRAGFTLRHKNAAARKIFLDTMDATADLLYNSPSVCLYTIFNEGWGQFMPDAAYRRLKERDPSRPIDATSGWFTARESDVDSRHIYFRSPVIKRPNGRPIFLSEFGGYSLRVDAHLFGERNYGYSLYESREDWNDAIYKLYVEGVLPLIKKGLSATVYTQLSDVEDETNGIITYDREVIKADVEKMRLANEAMYEELRRCTENP